MTRIRRGMILDLDLQPARGSETGKVRPCVVVTTDTYNARVPVIQVTPITAFNAKKSRIVSNVEINPSPQNGLTKRSIADCLQTRPVDYARRLVRVRGQLTLDEMQAIDQAILIVFGLDR